jgi:hypothetical protein
VPERGRRLFVIREVDDLMNVTFNVSPPSRPNGNVDKSSSKWHGKTAAGHALALARELGKPITKLGLLLIEQVANYGPECFVPDRKLADQIMQNNGRKPHRGSVARVRRELTRSGMFKAKRIHAEKKISDYASSRGFKSSKHGCVRLRLNHKLGFRVPEARPQSTATVRPRHGAPAAIVPRPALTTVHKSDLDYFQRVAAPAVAVTSLRELERESREDAAMLESVRHVRGPP